MRQFMCLYHLGLKKSVLVLSYDTNTDIVVYWDQINKCWKKDKIDLFQPT